ncbi:MAG: hypothetical protein ABSD61_05085 [Terracidiphilus sp.]|jgi:hypothetical protein
MKFLRFLRIAAVTAISLIIGFPAFVSAQAQSKPSTAPAAPPAAPPVQLQPYTASDQSASAGVPAGWKVAGAAQTNIELSGPQGEVINLGQGLIAHDGAFQLGQRGPDGSDMSMPYSAKLTDKLTMVLEQRAKLNGNPVPQIKFIYAAPLQSLPAGFQCGLFVIAVSGTATPGDALGIFCSLPEDRLQFYKNFLTIGSAPTAVAAKDVPTVAAVIKSFQIPSAWLQKKFAPFTAPASASPVQGPGSPAEVQMYLQAMQEQQNVIDRGATCADAGIIGTPNIQVARECGGWESSY